MYSTRQVLLSFLVVPTQVLWLTAAHALAQEGGEALTLPASSAESIIVDSDISPEVMLVSAERPEDAYEPAFEIQLSWSLYPRASFAIPVGQHVHLELGVGAEYAYADNFGNEFRSKSIGGGARIRFDFLSPRAVLRPFVRVGGDIHRTYASSLGGWRAHWVTPPAGQDVSAGAHRCDCTDISGWRWRPACNTPSRSRSTETASPNRSRSTMAQES